MPKEKLDLTDDEVFDAALQSTPQAMIEAVIQASAQSQTEERLFVVLANHTACHGDRTFSAGMIVVVPADMPIDAATYHVEAGTMRPYMPELDDAK